MISKKVTASIVLFKNDEAQIERVIKSYLNSAVGRMLYLIDNSPTDYLRVLVIDERIIYYHNPSNPGFGAAHNIALKWAIDFGSEYHLVLNPDVYFSNGTIERIVEFMDDNADVGNLMPKVVYPDGSIQHLCKLLPTPYDWIGRRFNPLKKLVDYRNQIFELRFTGYNQIMEVPYLSGCFMFLSLKAIREIGFYDERIFMYGEETDLCRRLISKNYKTIFYPEVTIVHEFARGSHNSFRLTWVGIKSAIYYFNKLGWFFDAERTRINKDILKKLGR